MCLRHFTSLLAKKALLPLTTQNSSRASIPWFSAGFIVIIFVQKSLDTYTVITWFVSDS